MKNKSKILFLLFYILFINCNQSNTDSQKIEVLFNNAEYDEVIKNCNEILAKIKSKEALTYRGKSNHKLGRYKEAFNDFYYLYNDIGDTSIETFEGLGLSSLNLDQFDYAYHIFEKLTQKDKSNSKNYFYLAIICIKTKKPSEAIQFIDDALVIEPNNTKYLNNKGLLLEETGRYREAVTCFSKIIENGNPQDTFYFNRAVNYSHLKMFDSSIIDLSKAIFMNSQNGFFYYNRAIVYMYNNEKQKACLDLRDAKSLGHLVIDEEIANYCNQ